MPYLGETYVFARTLAVLGVTKSKLRQLRKSGVLVPINPYVPEPEMEYRKDQVDRLAADDHQRQRDLVHASPKKAPTDEAREAIRDMKALAAEDCPFSLEEQADLKKAVDGCLPNDWQGSDLGSAEEEEAEDRAKTKVVLTVIAVIVGIALAVAIIAAVA